MNVHGAKFTYAVIEADRIGNLTNLVLPTGRFATRLVPITEIDSVQPITSANQTTFGGAAKGAAIGTLLAGPVGAIVGGILNGRKAAHLVAVTLTTGESFVAETNDTEFKQLLGAAAAAPEKRYMAQFEVAKPPSERPKASPNSLFMFIVVMTIFALCMIYFGQRT